MNNTAGSNYLGFDVGCCVFRDRLRLIIFGPRKAHTEFFSFKYSSIVCGRETEHRQTLAILGRKAFLRHGYKLPLINGGCCVLQELLVRQVCRHRTPLAHQEHWQRAHRYVLFWKIPAGISNQPSGCSFCLTCFYLFFAVFQLLIIANVLISLLFARNGCSMSTNITPESVPTLSSLCPDRTPVAMPL